MLLIDTAGRLQNKSDLMAELAKIVRVLKKIDCAGAAWRDPGARRHHRAERHRPGRDLQGDRRRHRSLVVTKLDGTARGGILVAIAERFKLPINAIGVGEGLDDLKPFDAHDFARAIAGAKSANEAAA